MSLVLFWIGLFILFLSSTFTAFCIFVQELKGEELPMYFYIVPTMFFVAAAVAKYLGI
jgi:hypothetical protein